MADVRIELKGEGVRELLRSPGVLANLTARARAVASAAGPGHFVDSQVGSNRARAAVVTRSRAAMVAEATNRTLLRAIGAAR